MKLYKGDELDQIIATIRECYPTTPEDLDEWEQGEFVPALMEAQKIILSLVRRIDDIEWCIEESQHGTKAESPWKNPTNDHA